MSGLEMLGALRAGEQAARDGIPITDCPYDHRGDTSREQALARLWLRGHDRVTPFPVDYSTD